jgi:hypothetical protein
MLDARSTNSKSPPDKAVSPDRMAVQSKQRDAWSHRRLAVSWSVRKAVRRFFLKCVLHRDRTTSRGSELLARFRRAVHGDERSLLLSCLRRYLCRP